MDENKRYKKYLNNSHKNRNKNISKTKKNISRNNKIRRNDEYKRLLQKPYYSKKANTFTHFKNPLFSHINSLIYKIEMNYDEFSYIYKPYLILFLILTYVFFLSFYNLDNSDDYSFYNKNNNFEINKYHNQNNNLIKIGYYYDSIKFGGVERVLSLLINYLSKEKYFSQCLITNKGKSDEEFSIPESVIKIAGSAFSGCIGDFFFSSAKFYFCRSFYIVEFKKRIQAGTFIYMNKKSDFML
jgi:hypothetical protein